MVSDNQRFETSAKSLEATLLDSSSLAHHGARHAKDDDAAPGVRSKRSNKAASIRELPDWWPLFLLITLK
jgi:hypothetical protein